MNRALRASTVTVLAIAIAHSALGQTPSDCWITVANDSDETITIEEAETLLADGSRKDWGTGGWTISAGKRITLLSDDFHVYGRQFFYTIRLSNGFRSRNWQSIATLPQTINGHDYIICTIPQDRLSHLHNIAKTKDSSWIRVHNKSKTPFRIRNLHTRLANGTRKDWDRVSWPFEPGETGTLTTETTQHVIGTHVSFDIQLADGTIGTGFGADNEKNGGDLPELSNHLIFVTITDESVKSVRLKNAGIIVQL